MDEIFELGAGLSGGGGVGGFGGGGGGPGEEGLGASGGAGGFGGGGGGGVGSLGRGGHGGFGGGGGGGGVEGGFGGFGGGNGLASGIGGGGLGAGGDIFVQAGASLTIAGTASVDAGTVTGGGSTGPALAGHAFANGIYLQGNTALTFSPTGTETVWGVIGDDKGSASAAGYVNLSGYTEGSIGIAVNGTGTLQLEAANTYTGSTTIYSGTLELAAGASAGAGAIVFDGPAATLQIDASVTGVQSFTNTLAGLAPGDRIDLRGLTYDAGLSFPTPPTSTRLEVQGTGGGTEVFTLLNPVSTNFTASSDGYGGTLVSVASSVVDPTVAVGTAAPGLAGDTLTLNELSGPAGAVTLSGGIVSFAAPANASGNVAFSYQIGDQLGDLSAVISDTLAVDPGPSVTDTTTVGEKVAHGTTVAVGTAAPGLAGDTLTLNELTTLGNGNDSVTAGANSTITLGNGNDTIYAGAGDTITLGSGHDTVYAGPGDTITLGSGKDLLLFGVNPSPSIMDTEIVNGFNPNNDIIEFNRALFANFTAVLADAKPVGSDTIITHDPNNTVTLHMVALSLLTPSNIKTV